MELSEKALRERGVTRSVGEIEAGVREMISFSLSSLPVGFSSMNPAHEFTAGEAEVLERGGLTLEPYTGKHESSSQTAARFAAMLSLSLTEGEVQKMLGVGASRVRQRVAEGSLYAVSVGRERRFPAFQFDGRSVVSGMGEVLAAIPADLHPIEVESWLSSPNPDLEVQSGDGYAAGVLSPREWLISGGPADALLPLARDL